jgi:hypothetical protein
MHNIFLAAWLCAAAALAHAQTSGRIEETSASFTAGWTADASRAWSGGTAAFSSSTGARATFGFSGRSVAWIGGRASGTGIARVYLDGALVAEVDTFSKTEEVRVTMFALNGLADGPHTLAIEVSGQRNPASSSPLVIIDAFDVPAQTVSRLQETDPDAGFSGAWVQDNPIVTLIPGITTGRTQGASIRAWSGGAARLATAAGARATFQFRGTAVSWIGARGTQSGIANVSLDGVLVAVVDLYSPTEQIQAEVFRAAGLAYGDHVLTVEATGTQNIASEGSLVVVDGFEVAYTGTRFQETHPAISYGAGWIPHNRDKAYNEGDTAETNTIGAQASITFAGSGLRWIGARGPQCGIARVWLDGALVGDIDLYSPTEGPQHVVYSVENLAPGTHSVALEVLVEKNVASTDRWVLIDAFDVLP